MIARRLYRLLLKFYPARFREEYGAPLERQFDDEYRGIRGPLAHTIFWLHAIRDLAISIPAEIFGEMRQDLAHAMRVYRRRPFTTGVALTALALTIGITTGIFSVINAVLFRSLPFRDPERLVQLKIPRGDMIESSAAFHAWAGSRRYLTDAAGFHVSYMTLGTSANGDAAAQRVPVAETSANFFRLLGSEPIVGRSFFDGEDLPGRDRVAIVGDGLWQQLGGDPRLLGSTLRLNGVAMTVIGIAPRGLDYPQQAAVWVPSLFDLPLLFRDRTLLWSVDGRLPPGVSMNAASAQYRAEMLQLTKSRGAKLDPAIVDGFRFISLRDQLAGNVRQISYILFAIVVFVLLTACANVAHLLLSRITERRREMALRAALGASRARLTQQLITETTVLTAGAAAAGLGVAQWAARLAGVVQPPSITAQAYTVLDWQVVLFAAGLAILTGFVFGVLPAGLVRHIQPSMDPLRGAHGHSRGVVRLRSTLVAIQAVLTVVLLADALTMCRSFLRLAGANLGLNTANVVTLKVSISGTPREKDAPAYFRDAVERLRALPGVESAGAVEFLPLSQVSMAGAKFKIGQTTASDFAALATVTPDYFRAMGTRIITGREFTAAEESAGERVAVVNEAFARLFPASLHILGKQLRAEAPFGTPLTIVGVTRNQLYSPNDEAWPMVYHLPGWMPADNMTLVARVHGDASLYVPICREAVRGSDPRVPVYDAATLDDRLRGTLARPRFYATAVLVFGGFALLLAAIGIYGAASFSITQRTHEIGVRLAIGAHPRRLRAMLLRESMLPLLSGLAVGVVAAMEFGKVLQHLVDGADPVGWSVCGAAALVLVLAAAAAVWSATRKIGNLDPVRVLRAE